MSLGASRANYLNRNHIRKADTGKGDRQNTKEKGAGRIQEKGTIFLYYWASKSEDGSERNEKEEKGTGRYFFPA